MKMNKVLILGTMLIFAWSCKKDDGGDGATVVPPRLLSEVALEDDAEIVAYLETHFYNYEEFETPSDEFDYLIKIDTIAGDNADKISLKNSVNLKSEVITVDSDDFDLGEKETDIKHTLYYLIANEGEGVSPTPMDSTYIVYEGTLLDDTIFDTNTGSPVWFDLITVVKGFSRGMAKLKSGGEVVENGDGTFDIANPGVGALFIPSGLAYFSGTNPGKSYAPIVFKVNMFRVEESDHDRDGVPTRIEDLNGDLDVRNDNTDGDTFPDYFDADDDGDGTSTKEEIEDDNGNIIIPYPDTDSDGVPDYLDPDNS